MSLTSKIFGTGKKAMYAMLLAIWFLAFLIIFWLGIIADIKSLSSRAISIGFIGSAVLMALYYQERDKERALNAKTVKPKAV